MVQAHRHELFSAYDSEVLRYQHTGNGPAMLFFNGFVCSTHYWPNMVKQWGQRYDTITWDYRGYGGNPAPQNLNSVNFSAFGKDAAALLDHLGHDGAIVVGHSMGVQVSLEFYRHFPERVKALVLICGPYESPLRAFPYTGGLERWLSKRTESWEAYRRTLGRALRPLVGNPVAAYLSHQVGTNPKRVPRHYIQSLMRHVASLDTAVVLRSLRSMLQHSAASLLPKVGVPVFVVGGKGDGLVPPKIIRHMADALPVVESRIYKQSTHLAMLENETEFNADLSRFLDLHGL